MGKIFIFLLTLIVSTQAVEIPLKHTQKREFSTSLKLNAKVVQLSNASQSVMSVVGGHIESYFVKTGQSVKKNQKIVLIKSMLLSQMSSEYISLKKQFLAQKENFNATKKLYEKGMTSMSKLNEQSMRKDELQAKLIALESQLSTLNIDTKNLKKATSSFTIYAHSDGVVSNILQPLHSSVDASTPIISLVKDKAYYLKSYLPLEYVDKVRVGQKIVFNGVVTHITQILPQVDEVTQRVILLSSIDSLVKNLYINTYTEATIYFDERESFVAVEKSALSFFQNEWVVFVSEHEEHNEEEEHSEDEHHHEEEIPYRVCVVKIMAKDGDFVGVEGIEEGEEYVSDKPYYVKSMLLKSSLSGHGH